MEEFFKRTNEIFKFDECLKASVIDVIEEELLEGNKIFVDEEDNLVSLNIESGKKTLLKFTEKQKLIIKKYWEEK